MIVAHDVAHLSRVRDDLEGSVALVPTMGNLHAGHLALVDAAKPLADRVFVSIFVNPTQFAEGEDFDSYPRTLEADLEKLTAHGVDLVFAPGDAKEVYPETERVEVHVPELEAQLCGANRPGHFVGVATVVAKLFALVRPNVAVFGEKDFQQLVMIRAMTRALFFPVEVVGMPTVRERDGLALSSRNTYLNEKERPIAAELARTLASAAEAVAEGVGYERVERQAMRRLEDAGLSPEYVAVRRVADLRAPTSSDDELVVLAAARLGAARLIDNRRVDL